MIRQCFLRLSSISLLYTLFAVVFSLLITVGAHRVVAADGDLDTTFGTGGKVTTDIGSDDAASSVALQSDGKIVAAGYSFIASSYDFALVRYDADGTPDTSFGTGGQVTTEVGSGNDRAFSVAIDSDGKIVVAGYSRGSTDDDFALVRYDADGTPDTTFDGDGKVTTEVGSGNDRAFSVAIDSDGKIVVAGYSRNDSNDYDFALVRYDANGSLDTSFGTGGKVTTAISSGNDYARSVVIQSDGKIVAAGYSDNTGGFYDFALVRYDADGDLDTTFDGDGKVTTAIGSGYDVAYSVAIQSDDKIVAAGSSSGDFALVRYDSDGTLDTSFNSGVKVTTPIGGNTDRAYSVAIQADGKIVVGGNSYGDGDINADFALARYNTNGSLDNNFGIDGKVTTAIGSGDDFAKSVDIQPDGNIVVAGYSRGGDVGFALARYAGTPPAPPIDPGVLWFITRGTQVDEEE
ncbi:delta-60 repeat domain-containing protein [Luminiphilus sp.]|nr:delta-60 repeat domain-containing protein [Luminiphilus sp.]